MRSRIKKTRRSNIVDRNGTTFDGRVIIITRHCTLDLGFDVSSHLDVGDG